MALTPIELMNGFFAIITIVISSAVGLSIASKYFIHKQRSFLFIGFAWIGIYSIWWGVTISVLFYLIIGEEILPQVYMFIGNGFLPLTSVIAFLGFKDLFLKDKHRYLILIFMIYGAIFEIYFLTFLISDYTVLGNINGVVDASYELFTTVYQIFCLFSLVFFGTLFARISLKSDKPELKLKGRLLLGGLYSFLVGAVFDILGEISIILLVLGRVLLILSSILFYGGYLLPNWMKRLFLNSKQL